MAIEYNFKYMPLVGKLSGESMVRQTETAINEIAQIVNENTAQAEIINTLAETANSNSVEALEKANEALETSGRVYITETLAVNVDNYCESQLIYINNAFSQNLPVAHKGFLEVKTNDNKTQATQIFTDDVDKKFYVRTGAITAETVGDVTTYTASYGEWTNIPNSTDLDDYLPLAGGTMSGDIEFSASEFAIKGSDIANDGEISIVGATDNLNGASLNLYGRNHTEVGAFELNANNGTNTKTLKGTASGSLTWGGDVTADNITANGTFVGNLVGDVSGNATSSTNATNDGNGNEISTTYLPLAGGTMTGNIVLSSGVMISNYNNTTAMRFVGGDATNGYTGKPRIDLFGNNYSTSSLKGVFALVADDSTNNCILNGYPNGDLKWNSKEVERVNASDSDYIRFQSGLQICWGSAQTTTSGHTYTFPVSFNTSPKIAFSVGNTTESNTSYSTKITNLSKTSFKGICSSTSNSGQNITCTYIAVGYWK